MYTDLHYRHNLHWISYHPTKSCFQSVVSPVVIGGGGGCRSWIEGVALIEPRWHLHTLPVPSAEWHQLLHSTAPPECSWDWPGWQRVLTLKVHLWRGSWEDGRGEEEVRKRRKTKNQEKEDWWSSWRSPPAMTFSDSTPSRCYSLLTITRGRIRSPANMIVLALQDFWHSKFTNLTHSRTSRNLLLPRKPSK